MGTQWCFGSLQALMRSLTCCFFWALISKKEQFTVSNCDGAHNFSHNNGLCDVFLSASSSKVSQASCSEHNPVCTHTKKMLPERSSMIRSDGPSRAGWSRRYASVFDMKLRTSVVFCPQGHVICCLSLGSSKGRLVWLMLPNTTTELSVGTFHWGQEVSQFTKEGSGFQEDLNTDYNNENELSVKAAWTLLGFCQGEKTAAASALWRCGCSAVHNHEANNLTLRATSDHLATIKMYLGLEASSHFLVWSSGPKCFARVFYFHFKVVELQ